MKKFFKYSLLSILLSVSASAFGQNVTTPYSMYGYGILGDRASSYQRQMGGVGVAMNNGRVINVMNPASYAAVDSLTFLFDMGADVAMLWSKEGSAKEHSVGGGLDYLTMQFPICKYMGGSIGMLPYSSVGYAFGNDIAHGTMENQGTGGINEAYIGVAGRYAGVSVGVNVSYDFGNISNDIYSTPTNSGQQLFEHYMQIRDWNIVAGIQYTANIDRFSRLTAGFTYSPKKSLHGKSWCTTQDLSNQSLPDTVGTLPLKGNYELPNSFGAGISYRYQRTYSLFVEADFHYEQWADVNYSSMYSAARPNLVIFDGMKFNNRTKYAVGAEFVPRMRGSYAQRIAYRLGGHYVSDYLNINGNGVKEYGVSCGLGFPTVEGKTMINVGLEWMRRSSSPVNMISENYFSVSLGINFNELWFWQRKIK